MPSISSIKKSFRIAPEDLLEIDRETKGWVLVHAESDITESGKVIGLRDVAHQCALGSLKDVLAADVAAISRGTQKEVELRLYFVDRLQFVYSTAVKREERLRRNSK